MSARARVARMLPRSTGARALVALAVVVVAFNVAAAIVGAATPEPSGPPGSAFATRPEGVAAWAALLRRDGRRVELRREPPADRPPAADATVVLLEPQALRKEDLAALRRFIGRGGRLVAGGRAPGSWLGELLDRPPAWRPTGPREVATRLAPARRLRTAGAGAWTALRGAEPLAGPPGRAVAARAGRVTLLADSSPVQNRLLAARDNAAFALALAPDRRVVFLESPHGYGPGRGLAALPVRWRVALAGLALAGLVLLWSRARRLGPAAPEVDPTAAPPRAAYATALGERLRRAPDATAALEPVRAEARRRVARRAALAPDAGERRVLAAARELGVDPAALAAPPRTDEEALALGRALAAASAREA